jgi:hypothetical protein
MTSLCAMGVRTVHSSAPAVPAAGTTSAAHLEPATSPASPAAPASHDAGSSLPSETDVQRVVVGYS